MMGEQSTLMAFSDGMKTTSRNGRGLDVFVVMVRDVQKCP
jgi:hypothetical protein